MTGRDRWILRMLYEHRVLTTNQLAELAFPTVKIARRRLAVLHDYRLLDRFRPLRIRGSAPHHWTLAPAGATVLAAEAGISVRELGYNHQQALAVAYSLHLSHTLGVNEWFATLVTRLRGHGQLTQWWSQTRCQRLWGDLARPDGFGRYTHSGVTLDFFLEYDLGTTALARVAAKLHGFAELARTTGVVTPVLLWVPTTLRETHARTALHRSWERLPDPDAVPVATAAAELLAPAPGASPADQVWLALDSVGATRASLRDLAAVWPRRTPPAEIEAPWRPLGGQLTLAPPPPCPPSAEDW